MTVSRGARKRDAKARLVNQRFVSNIIGLRDGGCAPRRKSGIRGERPGRSYHSPRISTGFKRGSHRLFKYKILGSAGVIVPMGEEGCM
jgi:hypothetical protein